MSPRSSALALALLASATTASSALAAHPASRFSETAQRTLTTRQYLQSIKPAKPTGWTAVVRARTDEANGYLSPMPWG